jgi:hypothetical protein
LGVCAGKQTARDEWVELRQEASDLQEYSTAKIHRVTRYLGVLADKARRLGWFTDPPECIEFFFPMFSFGRFLPIVDRFGTMGYIGWRTGNHISILQGGPHDSSDSLQFSFF